MLNIIEWPGSRLRGSEAKKDSLICLSLHSLATILILLTFSTSYSQPIVATWDWAMPKNTPEEQKAFVAFAQECGFNTVITRPAEAIVNEAHARGMKVFDVLYSTPSREFVREHPECLQKLQPFEEEIEAALRKMPYRNYDYYVKLSHREFPILYTGDWLCYEHDESVQELNRQIAQRFERRSIDGIALDFFGFKNMYGCFCDVCVKKRAEMKAAHPDMPDEEIMARCSEESLLAVSEKIYAYVKSLQPEATVTCHIYPPFNPNPFYGNRFRVDWCGQSMAWFFKPFWPLERVRETAKRFKELEDTRYNRFMPFVACFGQKDFEYLKKPPERLREELEIAKQYGGGSLQFATLGVLHMYPDLYDAARSVLVER